MENIQQIYADEWLTNIRPHCNNYFYVLLDPLNSLSIEDQLYIEELKTKYPKRIEIVLRPDLMYSPQHCPHLLVLSHPGEDFDSSLLSSTLRYA